MKKIFIIISFILLIFCDSAFAEGWIQKDGEWYYQNEDGILLTGFIVMEDGTAYYCDDTGKMYRAEPGKFLVINDNHYQNKFYVDEFGTVTMNDNDGPHWAKYGNDWYHYNARGVIDKDKWIYNKGNNRIYRVGYDGKMCKGWVADPVTHIEYYMDPSIDGGYLVMDNLNSTYTESFNRLMEVINSDESPEGNEITSPGAKKFSGR